MREGNNLIHEGVEFALLRLGAAAVDPILQFLEDNPGLEGREHLYAVLATPGPRAPSIISSASSSATRSASPASPGRSRRPASRARWMPSAKPAAGWGPGSPTCRNRSTPPAPRGPRKPLLKDWRTHWVWDDDEAAGEESEDEPEEEAWGVTDSGDLDLSPRWYDVTCPVCSSRLEYDSKEDEVNVLKHGKAKA